MMMTRRYMRNVQHSWNVAFSSKQLVGTETSQRLHREGYSLFFGILSLSTGHAVPVE